MIHKPKREDVEEMLNDFEAHELIGSRRDVYELVVSVLRDWLAQEEELVWIRKKLKLPDDAERSAVYGAMHCLENYAREGSKWLPITIKQRDEEREKVSQLQADNQELKRKGEQLCCRVGVLEMENQDLKDRRMELIAMVEQLKAENQALKERAEAIMQAIKDEPELPGPMPDGMLNDIEKAGIEEAMRIVVRETKNGILMRINHD